MISARGAVAYEVGGKWVVEDLELGQPQENEVLIKVMASGLCHSDEHFLTGDYDAPLPKVGGHEGAGVIVQTGSKVTRVAEGDHVATMFIPACGTCRYCAQGMQYICNNGAGMEIGYAMDGTPRTFLTDGTPVGSATRLGTFANYIVCHETQAVKIPDDIPFDVACLVSCGVATGYGAAVNAANIAAGDVVLIAGVGGVGMNSVQGAHHRGAAHVIVVDPAEYKRTAAMDFGATETYATLSDARPRIAHLTNGQGVDSAIITVGRVDGSIIGEIFSAVGKSGSCILVSQGSRDLHIAINPQEITGLAKTLKGVLYGECNPTADVPKFLSMYQNGSIKLDELVTRRYQLDDINQAYEDMYAGINIRGVLIHEH